MSEIACIKITRRDGRTFEIYIDAEDLPKLEGYTLYVHNSRGMWRVMAYTSDWKLIFLARLLAGTPANLVADHIDGDGLNNIKKNLRNITQAENNQNYTRLRQDNTSGVRGVSWSTRSGKWTAYAMVNMHRYHLGYFVDLAEAQDAVETFRAINMPFSKEARELCQTGE